MIDKRTYLIFLCDDEPGICDTYKVALEKGSYPKMQGGGGEQTEKVKFKVETFTDSGEMLSTLKEGGLEGEVDLVVSDIMMPDIDGFEVIKRLRQNGEYPTVPVLACTARNDVRSAVRAMNLGAFHYIVKGGGTIPTLRKKAWKAIKAYHKGQRTASAKRGEGENHLEGKASTPQADVLRKGGQKSGNGEAGRKRSTQEEPKVDGLIGQSAEIQKVREKIRTLGEIPGAAVLIRGETGTGKNLAANLIHGCSPLAGEFVEINCAAVPASMLESELFGHTGGAFTGAEGAKKGLFEVADEGTLFLDEIGAMPMKLQAKLLSFLENYEVRRLGAETSKSVTTRVICATNAPLEQRVKEGKFRKDLYFRIAVNEVQMPPLRLLSASDVASIAEQQVEEVLTQFRIREIVAKHREIAASQESNARGAEGEEGPERDLPYLSGEAKEVLRRYSWPGNVRELQNAIERSVIAAAGSLRQQNGPSGAWVEDLEVGMNGEGLESIFESGRRAEAAKSGTFSVPIGKSLEEVKIAYICASLSAKGKTYTQIADELGIDQRTLWEKRKEHGLDEKAGRK